MIINPYMYAAASQNFLAYPLTYDESDQNNSNTLTRLGLAPHVTPQGFEGDGYQSRLKLSSLPSWLSSHGGAVSFTAAVKLHCETRGTRDTIAFIGVDDATANPKLEICALSDSELDAPVAGFRAYNGTSVTTRYFGASNWKYALRWPVLTSGGNTIRPQSHLFIDSSTLLICGHYDDTESRCYKINLSDNSSIGTFTFGTSTHKHVASFAKRFNGDVWCVDYDTGHALKIDLDTSFTNGTVSITADWNLTNMGASVLTGIEFVTVSGTEYVLIALYNASTTTYLYVIPVTEMVDGSTFNLANRYKRFVLWRQCQGMAIRSADGLLYMSHNATDTFNNAPIYAVDISSQIASLADGGTLVALRTHKGPSRYPEDIKWHPSTGEAWVCTEGRQSVADNNGFLAYWRSPLVDNAAQENRYTIDYNGSGTYTFYINGVLFDTLSLTPSATPAVMSIGGPPQASAGWANGFCVATVKGLAWKDSPFTAGELANLDSGAYESSSITTYMASLTNAGAESGASTGWTTESGGMGVRSSNPIPFYQSGVTNTQYFFGGTSVNTLARQRLLLETITGLSAGAIDTLTAAGNLWARVTWMQANFNGTDDNGGLGLRYLDATPTQLSLNYGAIISAGLNQHWRRRTHAVTADSGARNVDIVQRMDRTSGTNNDSYHDLIELTIYRY
jgi:hypothetical protein